MAHPAPALITDADGCIKIGLLAEPKLAGPQSRLDHLHDWYGELPREDAANVLAFGPVVDPDASHLSRGLGVRYAVENWPRVPGVVTWGMIRPRQHSPAIPPIEPAMRHAGRHDWVEVRSPTITLRHGLTGAEGSLLCVYDADRDIFASYQAAEPAGPVFDHTFDPIVVVFAGRRRAPEIAWRDNRLHVAPGLFHGSGDEGAVGATVLELCLDPSGALRDDACCSCAVLDIWDFNAVGTRCWNEVESLLVRC